MDTNIENPFWLRVRKEYVFDNFQEMVEYLRKFDYANSNSRRDFDDTLSCVNELVGEVARGVEDTPFFRRPVLFADLKGRGGNIGGETAGSPDDADDAERRHVELIVRLMGVSFLASRKRGVTDYGVLLTLVNYLLYVCDEFTDEARRGLWHVVLGCMRNAELKQCGFGWSDVAGERFPLQLFVHKLAQTRFAGDQSDGVRMFENKGVMVLRHGSEMELGAFNFDKYNKSRLRTLLDVEGMLTLKVDGAQAGNRTAGSFDGLLEDARFFLNAQEGVTPSAERRLKAYGMDDSFVVRITGRSGIRITAETVDPAYEKVAGKVLLRWPGISHPEESTVREYLNEGALVEVMLAQGDDYAFDLGELLDNDYRSYLSDFAGKTTYAIYSHRIPEGTIWVTREGIRVIIHNSKEQELRGEPLERFENSIETPGTPLKIRFYAKAPDITKDILKVYAEVAEWANEDSDDEREPSFTVETADSDYMLGFIDASRAEYENIPREGEKAEAVSRRSVDAAAHLLYYMGGESDFTPMERLKSLVAGAALARMVGRDSTAQYQEHLIELLDRMVAFAHNREVRPLRIEDTMREMPALVAGNAMIATLADYRNPQLHGDMVLADSSLSPRASSAEPIRRVRTLVDASNSLVGIIGEMELNNIKMAIARTLGVDAEFEPVVGDRTFYGNESLTLEFKKSIVFPPLNKRRTVGQVADPDRQKWAILKAVCGFLNSRSGGELLLGVADNGYAVGLDDDIRELFIRKLIPVADMDHYRTYVQNVIDRAFMEYDAPTLSTDIVTLNVSYLNETNSEGKSILRVQVRPYPFGVVGFAESAGRPADYAESYIRRDGCTKPLTANLRAELESYKLSSTSEAQRRIIEVSNAISGHRLISLKDYRSRSGIETRTIEPYKIWKKRGLIYGYDTTRQAPRLFRLSRAAGVEVLLKQWTSPRCSVNVEVDHFGKLLDKNTARTVSVLLTDYGMMLLTEEIPEAKCNPVKGKGNWKWRYTTQLSSTEGLDRFLRGLPDDARLE